MKSRVPPLIPIIQMLTASLVLQQPPHNIRVPVPHRGKQIEGAHLLLEQPLRLRAHPLCLWAWFTSSAHLSACKKPCGCKTARNSANSQQLGVHTSVNQLQRETESNGVQLITRGQRLHGRQIHSPIER